MSEKQKNFRSNMPHVYNFQRREANFSSTLHKLVLRFALYWKVDLSNLA
jgi:hypothetical protein